ncbi:MAG: glycosyltransferase family 2 protein [Lentisphaerae bacterium]|nr:glycosyltransferase family 2 protein [Lentisphaerota bacterium]
MEVQVSVVVPAFNSAETIVGALESVEAQEFRDFEVIVVDDASTDDTVAVVEEFFRSLPKSESPTRRIIQLPANRGPAGARNRGIEEAVGEWIAFLDGDDVWFAGRLEHSMAALRTHPEAGMMCGGVTGIDGEIGTPKEAPDRPATVAPFPIVSLSIFNPVTTSTVTVRRDVVDRLGGFDEQFRGPEDYDLWIRVAASVPVLYSHQLLAGYADREGGLSMDDRRFLPEVLRVLDKAYGLGGGLVGHGIKRRAMAYQRLSASWMAARRGDLKRAWSLFLKALILWPFRFGPARRYRWVRTKLIACFLRRMWEGMFHRKVGKDGK